MAYHSAEDPDTYHTCENCPSGQQILPQNRRPGIGGRKKCEICDEYERRGVCK